MSTSAHHDRGVAFLAAAVMLAFGIAAVLQLGLGLDPLSISGWGVPCPFHALTGLHCPGCGMTRALVLVSQLELRAALQMNPFIYPLLGLSTANVVWHLTSHRRSIQRGRHDRAIQH